MNAIECVYYGSKTKPPRLTRSYTEAVWLSTLDGLQIPYEFENKRFVKPVFEKTGKSYEYLPDLFLPLQNLWIEIKGTFEYQGLKLTDPYCQWQTYNAKLFAELRKKLADPSQIIYRPEIEDYADVWAVAGYPDICEIMLYVQAPEELDCFNTEFLRIVRTPYGKEGLELGICPICGNLIPFGRQDFPTEHDSCGTITVNCSLCEQGEASFWPRSNSNTGRMNASCEASNKIRLPLVQAALFARSPSGGIAKAKRLNPDGTLYEFTRAGRKESELLKVAKDLFTPRRGVV